jgi:hypothetical protein
LKLNEEQKKTLYLKENKLKGKLYRFLSSGTVGTNFQQQRNHPIALMLYMFVVSRGLETSNRSVFFPLRWVIGKKKKLYYIKKFWLIFQAGGERDES